MTKHYEFVCDGFWDDNGCDCCGSSFMEAYTLEELPHACYSISACKVELLVLLKGEVTEEDYDRLYSLTETEVDKLLGEYDITHNLESLKENYPVPDYYPPLWEDENEYL